MNKKLYIIFAVILLILIGGLIYLTLIKNDTQTPIEEDQQIEQQLI